MRRAAAARGKTERQRRPLDVRGGVGEDAKAASVALDAVEQESRTIGQTGRDFGNAADLEVRVGALDPAQSPEFVDQVDKFAQVLVHGVQMQRPGTRIRPESG